jgi:hypothetical protein
LCGRCSASSARFVSTVSAGADVEFGLQLLISASADGLIVDSHLVDGIVNDSTLLMPAIKRLRTTDGNGVAAGAVTDRGFASADWSLGWACQRSC